MKHACPKCGHVSEIDPQQKQAAQSRWAGMTKEERSAEMSRIRKKGVKNKKARKRQPQTHNVPSEVSRTEGTPHA